MKKLYKAVLAVLVCATFAGVTGCTTTGDTSSTDDSSASSSSCTQHVDANSDGICDQCGEVIDSSSDSGDPTENVLLTGITVSTDDEENDGSIASPYALSVAQGSSITVSYAVRPSNATDKTINWTAGSVAGGVFTASTDSGLSFSDSGTRLTITASEAATSAVVQGLADDGSGVSVYLSVSVVAYQAVTSITSSALLEDETGEYDYVFTTALGTQWDMSGDMLDRGVQLLEGNVMSGLQAPRNLTYWPTLHNFGITVNPDGATDSSVVISYSDDSVLKLDIDGTWSALSVGETVITVSSYSEPDVQMTIKVEVQDSLYAGILQSEYDETETSTLTSWDLDSDHGTDAQFARYDDWHLVMVQSNETRGSTGIDYNQKIFYMGESTRPYGIDLENNVATTDGSLTTAASLMWAKVTIPESALQFDLVIGNNDKTHGQYRVLFVSEDGAVTELTDGWQGFATASTSSTVKLDVPESIRGTTGAMVVEHRVTEYNNNAELQIKKLWFEGQVDVTGIEFTDKTESTHNPGDTFYVTASVTPDSATEDGVIYSVQEGTEGVTVDSETGLVTIAENAASGTYYIIATAAADSSITATYTLTVTEGEIVITTWSGKTEITEAWSLSGTTDSGVGEGADLTSANSYWYNTVTLTDLNTLAVQARVFVRGGETDPWMYVSVVIDGQETVIKAYNSTENYVVLDTTDSTYDSFVTYWYDLSAYKGQTVELRIGIYQGTHCVIGDIALSSVEQQQLATPVVSISENVVSWSEVENADGYAIYIDGTLATTVTDVSYTITITAIGSYSITVQAVSSTYGYTDSSASEAVTYTLDSEPEVLAAPVLILNDNVVSWDAVENAVSYEVYVNSKLVSEQTATSYTITNTDIGEYAVTVIAVGNGATYTNSAASEAVTFSITKLNERTNSWTSKGSENTEIEDNWSLYGTCWGSSEGADITANSYWYGTIDLTGLDTLSLDVRLYARDGETDPYLYVSVVVDGNETIIRAIGSDSDYIVMSSASGSVYDSFQTLTYDLAAYIGQTVEIRVGITQGSHCVIGSIEFSYDGTINRTVNSWTDKTAIVDAWSLSGTYDSGVGEGADLNSANSYWYAKIDLTDLDTLTLQARTFVRDGETNAHLYVSVVVDGEETVIAANGSESNYVVIDTTDSTYDSFQTYTYDLTAYEGKTVEIRIGIYQGTHCVIGSIELS
ncbi:MAG: hypothetical protein LUD27_06445 [Clostridia bacterium]|nr:hypothetical protein [Clostridia bacterium]